VDLNECEDTLVGEEVRRDVREMSIFHLLFDIEDECCTKVYKAALEDVLRINPVAIDEENKAMSEPGRKPTISCGGSLDFIKFIIRDVHIDVVPLIQSLRKFHKTSHCYEIKETFNVRDIHDVGGSLSAWGLAINKRSDCEHRRH
jgi:hypothetical protein